MLQRGCFVVQENARMFPAWLAIGCIGCLCHSTSGSNCLMMYKAMHRLAPVYLYELCEYSCIEGHTARGDLVVQQMRSAVDVHLLSWVQRHGTNYGAPFATVYPWTVSRRLWKHFYLQLVSDCIHFHCCMHHIFSNGLYSSLELVTALRCLRNCRYIIIIIKITVPAACIELIKPLQYQSFTDVETSYFTQLKICYLITTFRCPLDILITSSLFTARWSTWPGNHLVPSVAELVGSWNQVISRWVG